MDILERLRHLLADELGEMIDIAAHAEPGSQARRGGRGTKQGAQPSPDSFWIPPGRAVRVGEYVIPGGMLYVGRGLPAAVRYVGVEPALIDPTLPVDSRSRDRTEHRLHSWYWSSYKDLAPQVRASYLRWLAEGRRDPAAPAGHVLLFFYGLERRLLADARGSTAAPGETDAILREVRRLLELYGHHWMFQSHATAFIDAVGILRGLGARLYESPPPREERGWSVPTRLKIGLGQLSADRKPLPPEWALAWLRADPDARLLTPAVRCREEFERLFPLVYREHHGEGIVLKPNKRRLRAHYSPLSPGLGSSVSLPVGDLPDVTGLSATVRRISAVADAACARLDAYSRWLGRHPDGRGTLAAAALLPPELATENESLRELGAWLEQRLGDGERAVLDAAELIARWPSASAGKLTKGEAEGVSRLLERLGYGYEPDPRHGGPVPSAGSVVLFRQKAEPRLLSHRPYEAAVTALHMAVLVAGADGDVAAEQARRMRAWVEAAGYLRASERQRLAAHLEWRLRAGAKLAGLKPRLASLTPAQRPGVGRFLVEVAAADGRVSPVEITLLTKLYGLLELDVSEVYSTIHALTTAPAREPVTVRPAEAGPASHRIPAPPARAAADEVVLDPAEVRRKVAESAAVSSLLGAIFVEDEEPPRPSAPSAQMDTAPVAGLDAAHASLLRALADQPSWARGELEALAAERGLLPEGALDALNEAALEACGEPVCEGDDPVEINPEALKELVA